MPKYFRYGALVAASVACMAAGVTPSAQADAAHDWHYVGAPRLLNLPTGKGYNLVFRLSEPIERRKDGSFDAGVKSSLGFMDEIQEVDRGHHCYVAWVLGRSKRTGTTVTTRLILGDGADPVGTVHGVRTLTARSKSRPGTAASAPRWERELAAARALGCSKAHG